MRTTRERERGWEYLLELVLLRLLVFEGPGGLLVERLGCELDTLATRWRVVVEGVL